MRPGKITNISSTENRIVLCPNEPGRDSEYAPRTDTTTLMTVPTAVIPSETTSDLSTTGLRNICSYASNVTPSPGHTTSPPTRFTVSPLDRLVNAIV